MEWVKVGVGWLFLWDDLMSQAKVALSSSGVGRVAYLGSSMARLVAALRSWVKVATRQWWFMTLGLAIGHLR